MFKGFIIRTILRCSAAAMLIIQSGAEDSFSQNRDEASFLPKNLRHTSSFSLISQAGRLLGPADLLSPPFRGLAGYLQPCGDGMIFDGVFHLNTVITDIPNNAATQDVLNSIADSLILQRADEPAVESAPATSNDDSIDKEDNASSSADARNYNLVLNAGFLKRGSVDIAISEELKGVNQIQEFLAETATDKDAKLPFMLMTIHTDSLNLIGAKDSLSATITMVDGMGTIVFRGKEMGFQRYETTAAEGGNPVCRLVLAWNGRNEYGKKVGTGVYRLSATVQKYYDDKPCGPAIVCTALCGVKN
ncbi:MAG: hypothetical protein JW795_09175 [Chitinivibrionales bacterium]|nr:hypothetical protein [Chitinivibrionales bacterium]